MGIGPQGLQFALLGRRRGANFERTLTIGRQHHFVDAGWIKMLFDRFNLRISEDEAQRAVAQPYGETLLKALGASVVDSIDASDFEGATIIHNLNFPIAEKLKRRYTCVLEYGTLEHVFNFPVALKNVIDMIEIGGTLLVVTPANNLMGHGFYQFSPELYYNVLPANGFADVEVYIVTFRWLPHFFRVADPRKVKGRVELVNDEPVQLGVIARKIKHIDELRPPIQSDYTNVLWKGRDLAREHQSPPVDPQLAAAVSDFRNRIAALASWPEIVSPHFILGLENRTYYELIDPATD